MTVYPVREAHTVKVTLTPSPQPNVWPDGTVAPLRSALMIRLMVENVNLAHTVLRALWVSSRDCVVVLATFCNKV